MFKLVLLSVCIAVASAGYIGYSAPLAYSAPLYDHAPVVAHAPVALAHTPVATSYANTYQTVHKPVLAAYSAPVVAHAPVAAISHAPVSYGYPYGLGYSSIFHRR